MTNYRLFIDPRTKEGKEIIELFNKGNFSGTVIPTEEGEASPELVGETPGAEIFIKGYKPIIDFLSIKE